MNEIEFIVSHQIPPIRDDGRLVLYYMDKLPQEATWSEKAMVIDNGFGEASLQDLLETLDKHKREWTLDELRRHTAYDSGLDYGTHLSSLGVVASSTKAKNGKPIACYMCKTGEMRYVALPPFQRWIKRVK